MQIRLLGPVEVRVGGRAVAAGGPRRLRLLAALALSANHPVSAHRLAECVWDGEPPASAGPNLRGYVAALRKIIEVDPDVRLLAHRGGYQLVAPASAIDAQEFRARVAETPSPPDEAVGRLRSALALWRGEPCEDVRLGPAAEPLLTELSDLHALAVEELARARLALGEHGELAGELRAWVARYPLRERLRALLITALSGAGRQTEALQTYDDARRMLAVELGVEPSAELQAAYQQVLVKDSNPAAPRRVPRQLPADTTDFTGRAELVDALTDLLTGPGLPLVAISGPAGVGKSALALRAAHLLRQSFSDGQLHVSLAGATARPRTAYDALGELLRSLGGAGTVVPDGLDERAALFRERVADRRILIVLDDAADAAQVRPLLPATPGAAVLVTGRARLAELPGVRLVDLDVLSATEAGKLLARIVGADRVAAEPGAAERIVERTGRLPLAVRIAGARLAARPAWPLRLLAERLDDERGRLDELAIGDLDVRASVRLSLTGLTERPRTAFRLLGLLPGREQPAWVLAALLDEPEREAVRALESLVDAHLLRASTVDSEGQLRYQLHDLLWLCAAEEAAGEAEAGRIAAQRRVLDGWIERVEDRAATVPASCLIPRAGVSLDPRPGRACAAEWFSTEKRNLTDAVSIALERGDLVRASRLAGRLDAFWQLTGGGQEWERMQSAVRDATAEVPELRMLADRSLGDMWCERGRIAEAVESFHAALATAHELGEEHEAACAEVGLAFCHSVRKETGRGRERVERALAAFTASGDRHAIAQTLKIKAMLHLDTDQDVAREAIDRALRIVAELGQPLNEVNLTHTLALLDTRRGAFESALVHLRGGLRRIREIGHPTGEAYTLFAIGENERGLGRHREAKRCIDAALEIFLELGDSRGAGLATLSSGQLLADQSMHAAALEPLRRSLALLRRAGLDEAHERAHRELLRSTLAAGSA
ncbi:AfsR/SARP family transcriptional regulator [Allokutzneria albata]|uniref:DNA-binding transcriptional activator of the SARP family n=1 Tax=Allokutzneria albata TaxID=211114 RepID=A0A1G9UNX3_ALLAB|nr:BTAD domain-containing putative transcriptional regulator [Allokutzneria albata]SDM61611.1 DNA-binding transcriptional activator of the SARP family [Allokutzneria albata]